MDVASIPGAVEGDVAELKSGDKSHKLLFHVKPIPQEVLDRIPTCQVSTMKILGRNWCGKNETW